MSSSIKALIEQKREEWVKAHNKALTNGDEEKPAPDDETANVDDDFYGAGLLLDEVRSRRKGRVSTSTSTIAAKVVPSRHSERLAVPHHNKSSNSPRKTVSGRRIIAPKSLSSPNLSSPSRNLRSATPMSPVKSAAQNAARSAVRRAAARVAAAVAATSDGQRRKGRGRKKSPTPSSPSPPQLSPPQNHEAKKKRVRQAKLEKDEEPVKPQPASSPQVSQKSASVLKSDAPPVTAPNRSPPKLSTPSICIRPSTIVGSVLTSPASSSSASSSSMPPPPLRPLAVTVPTSPFKTNSSPQARFPVRTISRISNQNSIISSRPPSIQSSPVRLPVRILHTSPSVPRPPSLNGQSVHHSSPILVRRANIVRPPMLAPPTNRPQQRYVVVSRGANNTVVMPVRSASNPVVRAGPTAVPVRRLIVQPRNSGMVTAQPRIIQRPGLGEYERPRLQFRTNRAGQSQSDASSSSSTSGQQ
ncbi:unnamed protein product [Strongylus vulgaris]|uniref:Uncharacterized protein n=1 Tax=Strongylus vulgaris TaxID=40348 RepID=A0A3P7I1Z2_STRVU|nr:unnamed protein product [Strongylus vulgaris]